MTLQTRTCPQGCTLHLNYNSTDRDLPPGTYTSTITLQSRTCLQGHTQNLKTITLQIVSCLKGCAPNLNYSSTDGDLPPVGQYVCCQSAGPGNTHWWRLCHRSDSATAHHPPQTCGSPVCDSDLWTVKRCIRPTALCWMLKMLAAASATGMCLQLSHNLVTLFYSLYQPISLVNKS